MKARTYLTFGANLIAVAAIPSALPAAEVLDQWNPDPFTPINYHGISSGYWHGQTFTPTGSIFTGVELLGLGAEHPWNAGLTPGTTITATLYEANGFSGVNLNLGAALGSATRTVPLGPPGSAQQWNGKFSFGNIDVSSYVGKPADQSLAVVFSTGAGFTGEETVVFTGGTTDYYAGGTGVQSNNGGATWTNDLLGPTRDLAFRTWQSTGSADQTDQYNDETNHSGWDGISANRWNGQSFTPDKPLLTGVEFYGLGADHPWNTLPDGTPITAEVWSASAGQPDQLLASVTRNTPLAPGGTATWTGRFDLSAPLDVSAYVGNPSSMFLVLRTPGSGGGEETTGFSAVSDAYAQGAAWVSTDQGQSWQIIGNRDMVFRTFGTGAVGVIRTWNVDQNGDWSVAENWNPTGAPNGVDAEARFLGAISEGRTVTLDTAVTVGKITFDSSNSYTIAGSNTLTMDVSSGSAGIEVVSGSHTIDAPIVLAKSTSIAVAGGQALSVRHLRGEGADISSGTVRILSSATPNAAAATSVLKAVTIASGAKLDLTNNSMVIDYSGAVGSLVGDTRLMLQDGRLMSSSADATKNLGYADNAALGLSSFAGQAVDADSLLIKYTYLGDTNLDGQVDVIDLGNLATAWQTSGTWAGGDSNYDGFVDVIDLGLLATNWQAGVGNPLGPGSLDQALAAYGLPSVGVPEPAAAALMGIAGGLLLGRKRRN